MCMLETGLVETDLTNQSYWWIVVLCNDIVRPPSPPPREDSHCTVNRPWGVTELVGKTLDMKKIPVLPWWKAVRE